MIIPYYRLLCFYIETMVNLSFLIFLDDDATTISSTLSLTGLQCCYHYKASEQLQFGVDLEGSLLQRDINATFAYQAQIPKSDINIKGRYQFYDLFLKIIMYST